MGFRAAYMRALRGDGNEQIADFRRRLVPGEETAANVPPFAETRVEPSLDSLARSLEAAAADCDAELSRDGDALVLSVDGAEACRATFDGEKYSVTGAGAEANECMDMRDAEELMGELCGRARRRAEA